MSVVLVPMSVVTLPSVSKEVSRAPVVVYRTTAKSLLLVPTATIFPSLCIATALPESAVLVPMSVVTLPSLSKEVSSEPSVLYRTAAKSVDEPEVPATMIFPSLCIATALPESSVLVPMSVVTLPSLSKEVSSEPSALYRTTAKFPLLGAMPPLLPATMIFPSLWIATAFAVSVVLVPMSVVTLPSVSKVVSSEPSVLYRTTSKSAMLSPTTSIFPLL